MNRFVQRHLVGAGTGTANTDFVYTIGFAHCQNPKRYIRQLVEDWGHQMQTHLFDGSTGVPAGDGLLFFSDSEDSSLKAGEGGIEIGLRTADRQRDEHWRGEIERQLDRIAFRFRSPALTYEWKEH